MKYIEEHIAHPDESLRVMRFTLDSFTLARHRHRHVELTWIERGSGLRFVGSTVEPFDDGDLVLLGPHVAHAWLSSLARRGEAHVATVVQFAPDLILGSALPELAGLAGLVARASAGLRIGGDAARAARACLPQIVAAGGLRRIAKLFELLDELAARPQDLEAIAPGSTPRASRGDTERRIDRVIHWIHANLERPLAAADAARLVHVTPAAFSRYFSREVGRTFTEYINDVRCSEACLRLSHGDRPVAEIAAECGFATLSHFNAQFKARFQATPRAFRRDSRLAFAGAGKAWRGVMGP